MGWASDRSIPLSIPFALTDAVASLGFEGPRSSSERFVSVSTSIQVGLLSHPLGGHRPIASVELDRVVRVPRDSRSPGYIFIKALTPADDSFRPPANCRACSTSQNGNPNATLHQGSENSNPRQRRDWQGPLLERCISRWTISVLVCCNGVMTLPVSH